MLVSSSCKRELIFHLPRLINIDLGSLFANQVDSLSLVPRFPGVVFYPVSRPVNSLTGNWPNEHNFCHNSYSKFFLYFNLSCSSVPLLIVSCLFSSPRVFTSSSFIVLCFTHFNCPSFVRSRMCFSSSGEGLPVLNL